jgi:hypothetical protein
MQALEWLARVGASSMATWSAAMGLEPVTMRSHRVRLERAGLVRGASRLRGQGGPLYYATALGVQSSAIDVVALRKPPAPVSFAHHEACAETAAYLTRRRREMIAPRELLLDDRWTGQLQWREHGELRKRGHRPDLIATIAEQRVLAIEVELTIKSPARLDAVLGMYRAWLGDGRIDSLLYIARSERERRQISDAATHAGVDQSSRFGVQLLGHIQARIACASGEEVAA